MQCTNGIETAISFYLLFEDIHIWCCHLLDLYVTMHNVSMYVIKKISNLLTKEDLWN